MTPLLAALYHHALEHRVDRYLEESQEEIADTTHMIQHAMGKLEAAGADISDYAQRLQFGGDTLSSIYQEAGFLAGLSIGLELGRL